MKVSKILLPTISFSAKKNSQPQANPYEKISIFGQKEIENLNKFAKQHKTDNIAVRVFPTPLLDCKFVKTQTDLIRNEGEWLDITDYDPDRF